MAVRVKPVKLWRTEVDNQPGALARVLGPLARAGADLHVVMGYRYPGNDTRAAIEVYPIAGKKAAAAAQQAGLADSGIPTLVVEGDNRPGLGHAIASAMAAAGINMGFLVAQVAGRQYSCVCGFENEADAKKAATLIKRATRAKKR